jgi:glycosyltransferase involved in cell wall biosynthesis
VAKSIIKLTLNLTNYNLAQSKSLSDQYKGLVKDQSKIGYIHNMIDISDIPKRLDYHDENIILFLGHLSHAKGYCDLIEVIPEVVKVFPDVKFCFAGTIIAQERNILKNSISGELIHLKNPNELFNRIIKGKFEKNYQYLGTISGANKEHWLSICNFMVMPSYSEGFSMSILEAIAHGKPVITTPVGALKDIISHRENGLLLQPGDKELLAHHIIELLSNKKLRNRIAQNNWSKRHDFSVEKIESEYIKLFKSLC